MKRFLITAVLGGLLLAGPRSVPAEEAAAPAAPKFGTDQLEQMVAPIALYPDALLVQVMIASTYPLEVVEADRWRRQNAALTGDGLDQALAQKDWDPSVEAMTKFPDVLKRMSENLDWTKDMGDAFLGQKDDVMAAVQTMRKRAQDAGNLQTTKQQTVVKEVVNNKETIVIQPAEPQVVYVPTYPPATAYGPAYAPPAPYYPSMYAYTPGQMATASLLSFGVGVGVGALISDGCDWGSNDVHVNNNYYGGGGGGGGNKNNNTNVNIDKSKTNIQGGDRQKWEHNAEHRRNVGYRDQSTKQKYERGNATAAQNRQTREQARGYEQGRAKSGAQPTQRPSGSTRPGQTPAKGGGAQQTARASGGKQGAFGDYGSGRSSQQASQRGASSRGGQSYAGSGAGSSTRQSGGGSAQRSGGGGGGGGRSGGGGGGGGGRGGGGGGRGGGGGGGGGRRR